MNPKTGVKANPTVVLNRVAALYAPITIKARFFW